jgi:N-methylhydantoinase B/oxoprolinase/acetone carboxylase alpha subunit
MNGAAPSIIEEEFPGVFVTTSADISPQFREFERFTTACLNAFLGPRVKGYIDELSHRLEEAGARTDLHVMTSNGGVTTAHHLDIGSLVPGSCGIVDAVDAYAEGLQFKAIKVYERGVKNQHFWNFLADNVRAADMVVGDMEAQIAACWIGAERYVDLVKRYGLDTVLAASEYLMNYSETMLRQEIAQLPNGTYYAEGFFDGYLDSPDPAKKDLKIAVTLTIKGSDLYVDFTGSSPQVDDRPINMPFEGTVCVAVCLVVRSIVTNKMTSWQLNSRRIIT